LFYFRGWGFLRFFDKVMEKNESVVLPAKKEKSVTQRPKLPYLIVNMFDVLLTGFGAVFPERPEAIVYFTQLDTAVFIGFGGQIR